MSNETPPSDRVTHLEGDVKSMKAALDEARLALAESGRRHEEALTRAEARADLLESQLATLRDQLTRLREEAAALQRRNRELEAPPHGIGGELDGSSGPTRNTAMEQRAVERVKQERRIRMVERARQLTRTDAVLALQRGATAKAGHLQDVDEE